jgi:hypothetical protein
MIGVEFRRRRSGFGAEFGVAPLPPEFAPWLQCAAAVLIVGGISIWSGLDQMVAALVTDGGKNIELIGGIIFHVGPTLLFPVWGGALAVAALGYYYRRRGPCGNAGCWRIKCVDEVHRDVESS